jgi:ribosomal protein S18 acetylase RimI-like enzyme
MWTAPEYRERGVGRLLVAAVSGWATARGLHTLTLMVTSQNQPAFLFYERLGLGRTGRVEPYPNDPALVEWEMACHLD